MRASQTRSLFFVVLVAGVAAVTLVWSLAAKTDEAAVAPEFGGDYVEGIAGSPARVNPLFGRENAADQTLVSLVFAGLTRLDEHGAPFPDMAETWDISPDGRTYAFLLRPNLVWHDGAPVTADDVIFTYEQLQDPGLPIPPPLASVLAGAVIETPDPRTVVITLEEPYSALPAYLTLGILPKHSLEGLSMAQIYDSFFNQQPIGSGPYRMERLTPSEAQLVANPAFHLDPPFIQRLTVRFYRDQGAVLAALNRREINAALLAGGLDARSRSNLEERDDLILTQLDTGEVTYAYLNLRLPIFQDRRVRQALFYALDRDQLLYATNDSSSLVAQSPLSPASWAYAPVLNRYDSDPGLANLLLDEAGWMRGSDGIRRRGGLPLAFTLTIVPDPVRASVAEAIASAWNALGAQVNVSVTGISHLVRNQLDARDYDALLWTAPPAPDPDPYSEWHSSQATGDGANLPGFTDPRMDAVLAEARAAPQSRRNALYQEFQELFAQELPALPLYVSTATYAQESTLQGVRIALLTDPGARFWQVQEWFKRTR